jgi:hypothetical protein
LTLLSNLSPAAAGSKWAASQGNPFRAKSAFAKSPTRRILGKREKSFLNKVPYAFPSFALGLRNEGFAADLIERGEFWRKAILSESVKGRESCGKITYAMR